MLRGAIMGRSAFLAKETGAPVYASLEGRVRHQVAFVCTRNSTPGRDVLREIMTVFIVMYSTSE